MNINAPGTGTDPHTTACGTEVFFLRLVASVLNGEKAPSLPENISLESLTEIGVRQNMAPILFCALNTVEGLAHDETFLQLRKQFLRDCMRSGIQMTEYRKLVQFLCAHGVKLLPLKGCVLKELYPNPELRVMSDVDILYSGVTTEELTVLMTEAGYTPAVLEKGVHDTFHKLPVMNAELHRKLIKDDCPYRALADDDPFAKAAADPETPNLYHMKPEDLYVHVLAHAAKHCWTSGMGVRTLADVYVLNRKFADNWDTRYIVRELKALGLDRFEKKLTELTDVFFGKGSGEATDEEIAFFFRGGALGADRDSWQFLTKGVSNRGQYMLRQIFPPYKNMCLGYPILQKAPVLLPVFWIVRVFTHGIHGGIGRKMRTAKVIDRPKADYAESIMKELGLKMPRRRKDD